MRNLLSTIGLGIAFAAILVIGNAFYVVDETQQVVITQFGEPMGEPITKAGLYLKMPFIQIPNYFEKRLLEWDGFPNEVQTLEKRYIWVDTFARWRIVDPLKFMQTVRNETSAQARLDDIIDGATRDVIANHLQIETIRNSNGLLERRKEGVDLDPEFDIVETQVEPIKVGREALAKKILTQAKPLVEDLGVELVDVLIKRLNYIEVVRAKVYERMVSERNAAAAKIRSEGQGRKASIEGQMAKELEEIRAEAYRKAQGIKGTADATAIKIYADAYNNDPEFYSFTKTLESYYKTINAQSTLILTTDSELYHFLNGYGGAIAP